MMSEKEKTVLISIKERLIDDIITNSTPHKRCGRMDSRGGINYTHLQVNNLIKDMGYVLGATEHAHGIGNNNKTPIVKRFDIDGYTIEAIIGYINYNYDIYCKLVHIYLCDKDHVVIWNANSAFRIHSENE